ncbi:MAG TPA: hypothetical protein ACFYEF_01185 [Candidatus Wunengus sp. YC63]|uniref:hypothetical protein n=1 Tax=Candidatus Wunengus sp. YC63 TaxID=3367699 RepID=UPI00402A4EA7
MNDHSGELPDNLAALIEEYLPSLDVFHSPASDKDVSVEILEQNKGDYVYFGKGKSEAFFSGGDIPFAVTRPGLFPGDFVNILFSDGHVEACKDYHDNPVLMNLLGEERE